MKSAGGVIPVAFPPRETAVGNKRSCEPPADDTYIPGEATKLVFPAVRNQK
jgi:hypothetical protein